jgi:hypothetical protein
MGFEERFRSIWYQSRPLEVRPPAENKCVYAQSFTN